MKKQCPHKVDKKTAIKLLKKIGLLDKNGKWTRRGIMVYQAIKLGIKPSYLK